MEKFKRILWIILGGGLCSLFCYMIGGILYILNRQKYYAKSIFKLAKNYLTPQKIKFRLNFDLHPISNTMWAIFFGSWMALLNIIVSLLYLISIVGRKEARYWINIALEALVPFGADIR